MVNDTLSDVLTRIRNGSLNKKQTVSIPLTRLSQQICHVLQKEGFIDSFERDQSYHNQLRVKLKYKTRNYGQSVVGRVTPLDVNSTKKQSCITNLKRISKPGLRIYTGNKEIPTVLGGLGILILSTPQGIMTDREARFRKVGGEILCSVW